MKSRMMATGLTIAALAGGCGNSPQSIEDPSYQQPKAALTPTPEPFEFGGAGDPFADALNCVPNNVSPVISIAIDENIPDMLGERGPQAQEKAFDQLHDNVQADIKAGVFGKPSLFGHFALKLDMAYYEKGGVDKTQAELITRKIGPKLLEVLGMPPASPKYPNEAYKVGGSGSEPFGTIILVATCEADQPKQHDQTNLDSRV